MSLVNRLLRAEVRAMLARFRILHYDLEIIIADELFSVVVTAAQQLNANISILTTCNPKR